MNISFPRTLAQCWVLLLCIFYSSCTSQNALPIGATPEDAWKNSTLLVVAEQDTGAALMGLTQTPGQEPVFTTLNQSQGMTIRYLPELQEIWYVQARDVWKYNIKTKEHTLVFHTPLDVDQMQVRSDGGALAFILESPDRTYGEMVECGDGHTARFCVLETRDLLRESTRIIDLPKAELYSFEGQWTPDHPFPLLHYERIELQHEFWYAQYDDGGVIGETIHILRPDNELPEIQILSGDKTLRAYRFDYIEEREPEGWLLFAVRGEPNGIVYKFPEKTVIGRTAVQIFPSVGLQEVVIRLGENIYVLNIQTGKFLPVGAGTALLGFQDDTHSVGINGTDEFLVDVKTGERQARVPKQHCGDSLSYFVRYALDRERLLVTPTVGKDVSVVGRHVSAVICTK